jgi:hypothetical protein
MYNLDNLSIAPSCEPTGSPTNNNISNPTYTPTKIPISGDGTRFVIMITIIFIVICLLYTYCRTKITSRVEVEQRKEEDQSRFSSVIIL